MKTGIWFIWFVLFVWLNQTEQMNQINKTNQFEHPETIFTAAPYGKLQRCFVYKPSFSAVC